MTRTTLWAGEAGVTLAQYIRTRLALPEGPLPPEYRYASLPLAVVDSVFSIGVRYETTQATVRRYAKHVGLARVSLEADEPWSSDGVTHRVSDLVTLGAKFGVNALAEQVFGNRQRTSTRPGAPLKSAAVIDAAIALQAHGVESFGGFSKLTESARHQLEVDWRAVAGQGSGISWRYFTMLAGESNDIKPDRMVCRFVENAIGAMVSPEVARTIVLKACDVLRAERPNLTPRELDYAIWQHQRSVPTMGTPDPTADKPPKGPTR